MIENITDFTYYFYEIGIFFIDNTMLFFSNIYDDRRYNFLFYTAFLPVVLMFFTDVIFTFILSFRMKELRFFNVVSPRSWALFRETNSQLKNNVQSNELRYHGLSKFSLYLRSFHRLNRAQAGDIIRNRKDSSYSIYNGIRMYKDKVYYSYVTNQGIVLSNLKPSKWASSTGSQRRNSIVKVYKKNDDERS